MKPGRYVIYLSDLESQVDNARYPSADSCTIKGLFCIHVNREDYKKFIKREYLARPVITTKTQKGA